MNPKEINVITIDNNREKQKDLQFFFEDFKNAGVIYHHFFCHIDYLKALSHVNDKKQCIVILDVGIESSDLEAPIRSKIPLNLRHFAGIYLFQKFRKKHAALPIILYTAYTFAYLEEVLGKASFKSLVEDGPTEFVCKTADDHERDLKDFLKKFSQLI